MAWLLGFWVLIPLLAWRSTIPTPAKWVVTAAAALFIVVAALSGGSSPQTVAAPTSTSPSAPSPTIAATSPATPAVTIRAPKLLGLSLQDAKTALQKAVNDVGANASLDIAVAHRYSSKPKGSVIDVLPSSDYGEPGATIPSGITVTLVVAKEIPPMPDVVGEKVKEATRKLKAIGYTVKTKSQVSSSSKGTVLAQSVPAGKRVVPNNTTVTLTVAKPQPGIFIYVSGLGSAMVTWLDGNFSTHQVTVSLPFKQRVASGWSGIISMSAQRQSGDSGSITCEIIDYGKVVKRATSSGPYSICSVVY